MTLRNQRSLKRSSSAQGVGFLTGADVTIRFLPAPENYGIAFQRIDCVGSAPIPARLEYTVPRERRTAISNRGVTVEMTEHVMAALAGLQVDNCLVQIDAPEPPGGDGSSLLFVEAIQTAGIVEQSAPRPLVTVHQSHRVTSSSDDSEVSVRPSARASLSIGYHLDYGPRSPIPPQNLIVEITPERFLADLAYARTFILETEIEALRSQGYGRRTTYKDLLVFGKNGPIDNPLRSADECVRHKILDCLGDFALLGCDVHGYFDACRSGHKLNRDIIRRVELTHTATDESRIRAAA